MARPSGKTDEKLIKAGCALIAEQGLSRLSLRAVAKKAGVNLGMFHYHFKDKADFSRRCTSEAYAEFYKGFEGETSSPGSTVQKLRRGLLALGRYSRNQRNFILAMLRDLEEGNEEAWDFIKARFPPPHGKVIVGLIKQGQKEGVLVKAPMPALMSVLMSAIAFPNLMACLAERMVGTRFLRLPKLAIHHVLLSDKAVEQRVDLAMKMLLKEPSKDLRRMK